MDALFLAGDAKAFPYALFTAHTAIKSSSSGKFDTFVAVPENTIPADWIDWAERKVGVHVAEFKADGRLRFDKTANEHLPTSASYRYFFDEFLPQKYRRLIYLDSDFRVRGDLAPLFKLNLGNDHFAAVADGCVTGLSGDPTSTNPWIQNYQDKLGWRKGDVYANTGLLLIDRTKWCDLDFNRRIIETWEDNFDRCLLVDQSALNLNSRGRFTQLSPVWNLFSMFWQGADFYNIVDPVAVHFTGPPKPWEKNWHHSPAETWRMQFFFRNSPWKSLIRMTETPAERKLYWRTVKRWYLHRLGLRDKTYWFRYFDADTKVYRQYVKDTAFADLEQGLVRWKNGILQAA